MKQVGQVPGIVLTMKDGILGLGERAGQRKMEKSTARVWSKMMV